MRSERETENLKMVCESFKSILRLHCEIDEHQYQHYDINVTGKTKTGVIEVKQRNISLNQLNDYLVEGLYIQKDKYDNLINLNSTYTNTFEYKNIKIILSWNIKDIDTNTLDKKWMTDSQEFSKTGGKSKLKEVYKVYLSNVNNILVYRNDKWKKSNKKELQRLISNALKDKLQNLSKK